MAIVMGFVRDFIYFRYSRAAHVSLLFTLFVVFLAQVVIAAFAGSKCEYGWYYMAAYYAVGFVVPVLAGVFVIVRARPFVERFSWFFGDSVVIELIGYATHMSLNAVAFTSLIKYLTRTDDILQVYPGLLIACTMLEYLLETILVYKLVASVVRLWCGTQQQKAETLAELKGKRGEAGVGADVPIEMAVLPM